LIFMRVTIVGAGVIGLSLAWELARRGLQVQVLERGNAGREASWAASGILPATGTTNVRDPLESLRALSHQLYPRWAKNLFEFTGIDSGLRRCGGIYLASSAGEAASLIANLEYQRDLGVDIDALTAEQLICEEPELATWARSKQFRAAVLSPDEYQIRPPDQLAALLSACRKSGVNVMEQTPAQLQVQDGIAEIVASAASAENPLTQAERIVICGGAWTGQLAASLGLGESVIPIRGQILMYRFDRPPLTHVINEGHRYLVPREDGRVLIGSCEEEVGFEKGTTPEMLEPLRRWAEAILPPLVGKEPEKTWSGLRPATFDGFPMIGKVPGVKNLYVASGHYRSGIHLAPATATVLAEMLTGETPSLDATAFSVGRMIAAA
jgi:glycine oxidase